MRSREDEPRQDERHGYEEEEAPAPARGQGEQPLSREDGQRREDGDQQNRHVCPKQGKDGQSNKEAAPNPALTRALGPIGNDAFEKGSDVSPRQEKEQRRPRKPDEGEKREAYPGIAPLQVPRFHDGSNIFVFHQRFQQLAASVLKGRKSPPTQQKDEHQAKGECAVAGSRTAEGAAPDEEDEAGEQRKSQTRQAARQRGQGNQPEACEQPERGEGLEPAFVQAYPAQSEDGREEHVASGDAGKAHERQAGEQNQTGGESDAAVVAGGPGQCPCQQQEEEGGQSRSQRQHVNGVGGQMLQPRRREDAREPGSQRKGPDTRDGVQGGEEPVIDGVQIRGRKRRCGRSAYKGGPEEMQGGQFFPEQRGKGFDGPEKDQDQRADGRKPVERAGSEAGTAQRRDGLRRRLGLGRPLLFFLCLGNVFFRRGCFFRAHFGRRYGFRRRRFFVSLPLGGLLTGWRIQFFFRNRRFCAHMCSLAGINNVGLLYLRITSPSARETPSASRRLAE